MASRLILGEVLKQVALEFNTGFDALVMNLIPTRAYLFSAVLKQTTLVVVVVGRGEGGIGENGGSQSVRILHLLKTASDT